MMPIWDARETYMNMMAHWSHAYFFSQLYKACLPDNTFRKTYVGQAKVYRNIDIVRDYLLEERTITDIATDYHLSIVRVTGIIEKTMYRMTGMTVKEAALNYRNQSDYSHLFKQRVHKKREVKIKQEASI